MTKEKVPCKCLSIIMLDSIIKAKKSIILKHFWNNVNMNKKGWTKTENFIDHKLEKSESDSEYNDNDNDNENDNDE